MNELPSPRRGHRDGRESNLAPVAALLMLAVVVVGATGGLQSVQTLREQARRAQCAGGLKQIRFALVGDPSHRVHLSTTDIPALEAPTLIESCLEEMEGDDA